MAARSPIGGLPDNKQKFNGAIFRDNVKSGTLYRSTSQADNGPYWSPRGLQTNFPDADLNSGFAVYRYGNYVLGLQF